MSHCAKIVFLQNLGDVKNEVFKKKIAFFVFVFLCWRNRNRKKKTNKMEKAKKPIQIGFLGGGHPKMSRIKKRWIFSNKNCLTLFVSGREKKRVFVHTICFGQLFFLDQKQCKPGKTLKIVVSAEIAQNQK